MKSDIATLAQDAMHSEARQAVPREASPRTRKLFVLLHGAYGVQFLAKFQTGEIVQAGPNKDKDKGVIAAMLVWDAALRKYPDDVIERAVNRLKRESTQFAPTLPQMEEACENAMPRVMFPELEGWVRLPAPPVQRLDVKVELQGDGKDWARKIVARAQAGDKTVTYHIVKDAMRVLGIKGRAWQ